MLFKLGVFLASPFLLAGAVVGATGLVLVDVKDGGPNGMHLVIPVPLALAQAALTLAPDEAKYIACPNFAPYQDVTVRILEELETVPDCTLVEVLDGDESVTIRKEGRVLSIDVTEGARESVHVKIPIAGALKAVRAYDGTGFPTKAAIWGLRRAPMGTLVHVTDGEDEVKIRVL